MILEVEQAVDRLREVLGTAIVDAAVQSPEEELVTHVVPHEADGDLVVVDGVLNLDTLARAIIAHNHTNGSAT